MCGPTLVDGLNWSSWPALGLRGSYLQPSSSPASDMAESHGHPLLIGTKETVPCLYQSRLSGGQTIFNDKENESGAGGVVEWGQRHPPQVVRYGSTPQRLDSNYIQIACEGPRAVLPVHADGIVGIFMKVFPTSARRWDFSPKQFLIPGIPPPSHQPWGHEYPASSKHSLHITLIILLISPMDVSLAAWFLPRELIMPSSLVCTSHHLQALLKEGSVC